MLRVTDALLTKDARTRCGGAWDWVVERKNPALEGELSGGSWLPTSKTVKTVTMI